MYQAPWKLIRVEWPVPSATRPDLVHTVSLLPGPRLACSCEAGQNGRPCWHQRLVRSRKHKIEPRRIYRLPQ